MNEATTAAYEERNGRKAMRPEAEKVLSANLEPPHPMLPSTHKEDPAQDIKVVS